MKFIILLALLVTPIANAEGFKEFKLKPWSTLKIKQFETYKRTC